MAAGYAALKHIKDNPGVYKELEEKSSYLEKGFKENINAVGKNYAMNRVGSMMCMFFYRRNLLMILNLLLNQTLFFTESIFTKC